MAREANQQFQGKKLEPFNFHRRTGADCIGLRLYSFAPDELAAIQESGSAYPGMFHDAATVVFLCSSPNSTAMKAQRAPDVVRAEMNAWGEKIGLTPQSPAGIEALEVFGFILESMMANEAEQVTPSEGNELSKRGGKKKAA